MRIEELRLGTSAGWPALEWKTRQSGLSVIYGPPRSGKSTLAGFLGHVLFGQQAAPAIFATGAVQPEGEAIVESHDRRYRLRRYHEGPTVTRLTIAPIDNNSVDHRTIQSITHGLSPSVLGPLCAVDFRESPQVARLLSPEFADGFRTILGGNLPVPSARTAELAARRDQLAHELETRIAGERRASKELDVRFQELDRLVRHAQQQLATCDERRQAAEAALAETDARLRYRRLELGVDFHWNNGTANAGEQPLQELDEQIARWRKTLAEIAERQATLRARLATVRTERAAATGAVIDQRAWLNVARQLAADLAGEVSRLARAAASQQCVCHDAHPRLRPIAETLQRQLDGLATLLDEQYRCHAAAELQTEVEHLEQAEADLRRHVEQLLDRRQVLARPARSTPAHAIGQPAPAIMGGDYAAFSAADIEQLEQRRLELEQERFHWIEQLREHKAKLRDARAQRDTVERQRAALLSTRSIEHVQRELADVQRKLEHAASGSVEGIESTLATENPSRASDFLAQLTNGNLVRLVLIDQGRRARVVDRSGEARPVEALSAAERDVVYLSLCLALLSAAAQQGIWLPLVLDDPFLRLDPHATASLTTVLDAFARQGHQVLVLTGQQAAAERMVSLGVTVHHIAGLRQAPGEPQRTELPLPPLEVPSETTSLQQKPARRTRTERPKRKNPAPPRASNGKSTSTDRSDAA